jgi:hypothetical protein
MAAAAASRSPTVVAPANKAEILRSFSRSCCSLVIVDSFHLTVAARRSSNGESLDGHIYDVGSPTGIQTLAGNTNVAATRETRVKKYIGLIEPRVLPLWTEVGRSTWAFAVHRTY